MVPWIIPFISITHFLEVKSSLGLILFVGASWIVVGKTTFISWGSLGSVIASTTLGFSLVLLGHSCPIVSHCEPPEKRYLGAAYWNLELRKFHRMIFFLYTYRLGAKPTKLTGRKLLFILLKKYMQKLAISSLPQILRVFHTKVVVAGCLRITRSPCLIPFYKWQILAGPPYGFKASATHWQQLQSAWMWPWTVASGLVGKSSLGSDSW